LGHQVLANDAPGMQGEAHITGDDRPTACGQGHAHPPAHARAVGDLPVEPHASPQTVDSRLQSGPLRLQRWVTQVRRGAPDLDTVGQRGHGGGQEGHGVRRDDEGPPCLRTDATALGDKATHGSDPGVRRGVDVRGERSPLDGTRHGGTPDEAGEGGMLSQRFERCGERRRDSRRLGGDVARPVLSLEPLEIDLQPRFIGGAEDRLQSGALRAPLGRAGGRDEGAGIHGD